MNRADAIAALHLFGSTPRNEAASDSDLDPFVDSAPDSLFSPAELVGIKQLLEARLSVPIDIATRDSLDPLLRGEIERSAARIF